MGHPRALVREVEQLFSAGRWAEIEGRLSGLPLEDLRRRPELAFALSVAELHAGALAEAEAHARLAQAEFLQRGDRRNYMRALNLSAAVRFERGDPAGAEIGFAEVLDEAAAAGLDALAGHAANNLGAVWSLRGKPEHALGFYRLCLPLYKRLGDGLSVARAYHNLGIVHRDAGRVGHGQRYFERAERRARVAGDRRLAAMSLAARADLAHRRGDGAVAVALGERALEDSTRAGDPLGRCDALRVLGAVAAARQRGEAALDHLGEAHELARRHGNRLLEAEVLRERGVLWRERGAVSEARADLMRSAELFDAIGARREAERTRLLLRRRD